MDNVIQEASVSVNSDCKYMILGTLGTFGIDILWFSNQYTDVLKIVNSIKCKCLYDDEKMYLAAHTMFSKNSRYNQSADYSELISQIQGKALVQVTIKRYIGEKLLNLKDNEEVVKKLRNPKQTCGEYDLAMEMDARDAYVCFEEEKIFNHAMDSYQKDILQTKVTFVVDIDDQYVRPDEEELSSCDASDNPGKPDAQENVLVKNLSEVKEAYEELRTSFEKEMEKTTGMLDTLDSLLVDYRCNVSSAFGQNWSEDFSYVFLQNIRCMNDVLGMKGNAKDELMVFLRSCLNNLKQQIFHISESNNLNFELPKCHLRYTGQEDLVLFAYMGAVKEILEIAYKLESSNCQTEIIPMLTVDVVPIIEAELYFDQSGYVSEDIEDQKFKILTLHLPHVSLYEIPLYIQYLYHEIYHYIVPIDREKRDYIMGSLLAEVYVEEVLSSALIRPHGNMDSWDADLVGRGNSLYPTNII